MDMHREQHRRWLRQVVGEFVADPYLHDASPFGSCVGLNAGWSPLAFWRSIINVSPAPRFAPATRYQPRELLSQFPIQTVLASPDNHSEPASPPRENSYSLPQTGIMVDEQAGRIDLDRRLIEHDAEVVT